MKLPACAFVIFGATGDLTKRKLIPALYALHMEGLLDPKTKIIATGRKEYTETDLQKEFMPFIKSRGHWKAFCKRIVYHKLEFHDDDAYRTLNERLQRTGLELKLFYFATSPDAFPVIIKQLHKHKIATRSSDYTTERLVFEKPFGHDLRSAQQLNKEITTLFNEKQIYRIDHYLGKELVQDILILRFTNPIFESLWNAEHIDNVQIISTETDGVLDRGGYYDDAGALRDMVQNHLLQLLSLIAMESPAKLSADEIRNEKVKALKAIALPRSMSGSLVLGQYTAGSSDEKRIPDYRKEKNVKPGSKTETFVAVKLMLENKRWSGVPFYLRTGKALKHKYAEIVIVFKQLPCSLFKGELAENKLVIRIQPDEGIKLQFNLKDKQATAAPVTMDFSHEAEFGMNTAEAYQRLLADIMQGDQTLFTRWDEVEQAWKVVDRMRSAKAKLHQYQAGTHGPAAALELMKRDGRDWSGNKAIKNYILHK
jgi:glucose-6-phosphate 1-dehydrogenase